MGELSTTECGMTELSPRIEPRDAAELRRWLARRGRRSAHVWVVLSHRTTGRSSLTWPLLIDECLCQGWIDGVRRRVDATRYAIRISPRRAGSSWSDVNVARVAALERARRMRAAGRAAFAARTGRRGGMTSLALRAELDGAWLARMRADARAWSYYRTRSPAYRRDIGHWVTSAKREATREARFEELREACARSRGIASYERAKGKLGAPAAKRGEELH